MTAVLLREEGTLAMTSLRQSRVSATWLSECGEDTDMTFRVRTEQPANGPERKSVRCHDGAPRSLQWEAADWWSRQRYSHMNMG